MNIKLIADENIPFQVVQTLREAGYEVATVGEVARPGIRNDELAKLSIQLKTTIITRDADFTHLKQSLMRKHSCVLTTAEINQFSSNKPLHILEKRFA